MFPTLDRNIPHVEDKILSCLKPKDLATSMLVCREWCQKAKPFLYKWYATIQRKKGLIPLHEAINSCYDHLAAFLIKDKRVNVDETSFYGTALMTAAFYSKGRITKMLLEREDIDINKKCENPGHVALHLAASRGCTALHIAASRGHASIVKMLLERKDVLVNARCKQGRTALIVAAIEGHANVVEELLQHPDIDVNMQDIYGQTALSCAKMFGRNHTVVIKMLEESNAK